MSLKWVWPNREWVTTAHPSVSPGGLSGLQHWARWGQTKPVDSSYRSLPCFLPWKNIVWRGFPEFTWQMPDTFSCKRSWPATGVEQRDIFWVLFLWDWLQPAQSKPGVYFCVWEHNAASVAGTVLVLAHVWEGNWAPPLVWLGEAPLSRLPFPHLAGTWTFSQRRPETSGHRLTLSRFIGELYQLRGHLSPEGSVEAQKRWRKSNKGWCRDAASSTPFINEKRKTSPERASGSPEAAALTCNVGLCLTSQWDSTPAPWAKSRAWLHYWITRNNFGALYSSQVL